MFESWKGIKAKRVLAVGASALLILGMLTAIVVIFYPTESKKERFVPGQAFTEMNTAKVSSSNQARRLEANDPQAAGIPITTLVRDIRGDRVELLIIVGNVTIGSDSASRRWLDELPEEDISAFPFCLASGNLTEGSLINLLCPKGMDHAFVNIVTYSAKSLITSTETQKFSETNSRAKGGALRESQGPCRFYEQQGSKYYCPDYKRIVGDKTITYRTTIGPNSVFSKARIPDFGEDAEASQEESQSEDSSEYQEDNELNMRISKEAVFDKETGQLLSLSNEGNFDIPTFSTDDSNSTNITDSFTVVRHTEYFVPQFDLTPEEIDSLVRSLQNKFDLSAVNLDSTPKDSQVSGDGRRLATDNLLSSNINAFQVLNNQAAIRLDADEIDNSSIDFSIFFSVGWMIDEQVFKQNIGREIVEAFKNIIAWKKEVQAQVVDSINVSVANLAVQVNDMLLVFNSRATLKKIFAQQAAIINAKMKSDLAAASEKSRLGTLTDSTILNTIYNDAWNSFKTLRINLDLIERSLQVRTNYFSSDLNYTRSNISDIAANTPNFGKYNSTAESIVASMEPILSTDLLGATLKTLPSKLIEYLNTLNNYDVNWDPAEVTQIRNNLNLTDWATALNSTYAKIQGYKNLYPSRILPAPVRLDFLTRDLADLNSFVLSSNASFYKPIYITETIFNYTNFLTAFQDKLKGYANLYLNTYSVKQQSFNTRTWNVQSSKFWINTPIGSMQIDFSASILANAMHDVLVTKDTIVSTYIPKTTFTLLASAGLDVGLGQIFASANVKLDHNSTLAVGLKLTQAGAYCNADYSLTPSGSSQIYYLERIQSLTKKCYTIGKLIICNSVQELVLSDPRVKLDSVISSTSNIGSVAKDYALQL